MKKNLFVLFLLILPMLGFSQARKVWMYHADNFFEKADYHNALLNYQSALSDSVGLETAVLPYEVELTRQKLKNDDLDLDSNQTVPVKDYLGHQIAVCYLRTFDYKKAVENFEQTAQLKSFPDDIYYLGEAQMNVNKYEEAVISFESYIKSDNYHDSLLRSAQLSITGCYYAMDDSNFKEKVYVSLSDSTIFNKGTASFAPMYFGNENKLMFTSAREGGVVFDPEKQQSEFLLDLYWTEKDSNGNWGEAKNFGRPLNSAQHDASSVISNKNIIYYTRWNDEDRMNQTIHLARMVNMKFYEAFKLPASVNVEGYRSINPFVSMDGKTLFFSSDMPGGEGGLDLWQIELDESGNPIGEAINLGRPINSELDEVTPFFHEASSTLFFSSNGHNSIGGLDIYKSSFHKENKTYNKPINLGMPINSSKDDAYMIWDRFLDKGYFASDRGNCESGHCYDIYEISNEPIVIVLEGFVYNADTDEKLSDATLTFKDIGFIDEPFEIITDKNGFYHTEIKQGVELFIKAQKPKFFADAASVNTKSITESIKLLQDFYLRPIPQDEIEIDGIEYDFNSAKLRPSSEEILDQLYEFLILNNNLVVEINSHTDERGSEKYNQGLSDRRAKSCVDYLIEKGIAQERLVAIGYGESKPNLLKDENKKKVLDEQGNSILLTPEYIKSLKKRSLKEEYHQRNRRTAFKVVGEGFKKESR